MTCRTHNADDDSFREFVMRTLALQDFVIARALQNGTLLVKPWVNRFGGTNWMIYEGEELIEVCLSQAEADDKVAIVAEALLA